MTKEKTEFSVEKVFVWFMIVIFTIAFISGIWMVVNFSINDWKADNFCEEKGFEFYERVGNYFNCCNEEIVIKRNDSSYYIEEKQCIAGGIFRIKK